MLLMLIHSIHIRLQLLWKSTLLLLAQITVTVHITIEFGQFGHATISYWKPTEQRVLWSRLGERLQQIFISNSQRVWILQPILIVICIYKKNQVFHRMNCASPRLLSCRHSLFSNWHAPSIEMMIYILPQSEFSIQSDQLLFDGKFSRLQPGVPYT